MKKILIVLLSLVACISLQARDVSTISQAVGHEFAEALIDNGFVEINMPLFLKGLKNYVAGGSFPSIPEDAKLDVQNNEDLKLLSESAGHLFGQMIDIAFTCDHQHLIRGIEDYLAGDESPLSEDELEESVGLIAKKAPKALADNLIKLIEAFQLLGDDDE